MVTRLKLKEIDERVPLGTKLVALSNSTHVNLLDLDIARIDRLRALS